jgi:mannitol/fructose-specific phosphotransferase system IIA component (Ntr-type)
MALGLARQGVTGVPAGGPGQLVFLILSPANDPNLQVGILAEVSRAGHNEQLLETIRSAGNAEEVLEAATAWEETRSR